MTAASAFVLAAVLVSGHSGENEALALKGGRPVPAIAAAVESISVPDAPEPWMFDRKVTRPGAVKVMYGTLGMLQALDIYSTKRALARGAREANPALAPAAGNQAAMIAAKALSTAGTIYFTERAWKKNRKGAIVLMAAINGVTAAVVARNVRNAR